MAQEVFLVIPSLFKTDLVLGSSEGDAWLPPVTHLYLGWFDCRYPILSLSIDAAANIKSYLIPTAASGWICFAKVQYIHLGLCLMLRIRQKKTLSFTNFFYKAEFVYNFGI